MTTLEAGLRLDFTHPEEDVREPFILQAGQDRGRSPVLVRPFAVHAWTRDPKEYETFLDRALVMEAPGRQRVRLYCSAAAGSATRLLVLGGSHKRLGRRQEPLLETLTWTHAHTRRLRFHYDQPGVRIVERTRFFQGNGQETQLPDYDPFSGEFHHPQEVTGALVVEYAPGFSLYEIEYDHGASQIPQEWFREMQLAWLAGDIHNATIPQVRVIAMGPGEATQISLARDFWPPHSTVRTGYRSSATPVIERHGDGYRLKDGFDDPCWLRCKKKVRPEGAYLTGAEMQALRACVAAEQSPKYHYVEQSRTVKTERIVAPDNPELYLDVTRPVELVMQLQRADGGTCDNHAPPGCCPELRLRFATDG